jgi:plastocyanin
MSNTRITTTLTSLLMAGALLACGGGDAGQPAGGEEAAPAGGEAAAPMQVANAGTIMGMVNFDGMKPANDPIDMSEEPDCEAVHPETPTNEHVVGDEGKLGNVFVRITGAVAGGAAPSSEPVIVDQVGCIYIPHVTGVGVGQGIEFKNSDPVAHNVQATPSNNRPFNISQPLAMTSPPQRFATAEIMIPVQCQIHGWMQSYVGVVEHPYFATSAMDGSFTIANVPPGTYTLEAWHEQYGTMTQEVTVPADGTVDVAFGYSAGMAENAVVPLGEPFDPHFHTAEEIAAHRAANATDLH